VRSACCCRPRTSPRRKIIGGGLEAKSPSNTRAEAPGFAEVCSKKNRPFSPASSSPFPGRDPSIAPSLHPFQPKHCQVDIKIRAPDGANASAAELFKHVGEKLPLPTVCERCTETLAETNRHKPEPLHESPPAPILLLLISFTSFTP